VGQPEKQALDTHRYNCKVAVLGGVSSECIPVPLAVSLTPYPHSEGVSPSLILKIPCVGKLGSHTCQGGTLPNAPSRGGVGLVPGSLSDAIKLAQKSP
jgi:hypothetical protein